MARETRSSTGGGIGLIGVLLIVFIVLKLTGNIEWGWLWVLSPLWIPVALLLASILIAGIVVAIVAIIGSAYQLWFD